MYYYHHRSEICPRLHFSSTASALSTKKTPLFVQLIFYSSSLLFQIHWCPKLLSAYNLDVNAKSNKVSMNIT